ncbi:MAG TPA: DNA polymerase III subunit delta [Xanthobacteraceae bacterium]|nr:DNA polymerase III subunit delta [Xanthobacteraceae bacterium]
MVAVKAADVDAYLARLDRAPSVVLVFGPDAGLVSERVDIIIKASVDDPGDPFSLVRLEGEEVSAHPARLIEEAQTIPLFGGRRAVWVKAGGRSNLAPAVEELLALPACEGRVVIEAGELRRNASLRVLCERARNAAALPCYADSERDLARLIDSEMRAAGLALAPDARALLIPLLGGDRVASRSEIRKLVLYAAGRAEVGVDDVAAVVSDASALALDDLVDAVFAGRPADLEAQLAKARAAGSAVGSIFFAAQRQLAQLHKWRTAIEAGARLSLDALQPPLHFRRKGLVEAALRQWSAARLAAAMADLADAVLTSRRMPALADTVAERALLSIALQARRGAA